MGEKVLDPGFSNDTELQQFRCTVCDVSMGSHRLINLCELSDVEGLFNAITNLYQLAQKAKLSRPRVAAIIAMKRLLSHFGNLAHLDISNSSIGRWCLQGLKSSMRDLRIAAGWVRKLFLHIRLTHFLQTSITCISTRRY